MAQPTTQFGNTTLSAMRLIVYKGLRRESSDPVQGLDQTSMNAYINKWDAFFKEYARWNFQGFRKTKIVQWKQSNTVYSNFTTAATYIDITSNANAAADGGRISINRDEIDYSAKDTPNSGKSVTVSTATDALGIDVNHDAGEIVEFLTAVPADFNKPGEIWLMNTSGNSAGQKLKHKDQRDRYWPLAGTYYYHNGYLYLPQGTPSQNMQLHYWSKGMKLVNDGDNLQTPEKWQDFVKYCAMAECYIALKEFAEADKLFELAGAPTKNNPEPTGLLQFAVAQDAIQTDSQDEIFEPEQVPQNLTFSSLGQ